MVVYHRHWWYAPLYVAGIIGAFIARFIPSWIKTHCLSDDELLKEIEKLEGQLTILSLLNTPTRTALLSTELRLINQIRHKIVSKRKVLRVRHKKLSDEEFRVWLELNS